MTERPPHTRPGEPEHPAPLNAGNEHQPITVRFGIRLRNLRKEHLYTQHQLAEHLGIDRSHISEIERGRSSISLALLEVIAMGYKMTLSELLADL